MVQGVFLREVWEKNKKTALQVLKTKLKIFPISNFQIVNILNQEIKYKYLLVNIQSCILKQVLVVKVLQ